MRSKDKLKKEQEKNEKTRKVILYSLLLIIASVAVFVGATYAWFSDSVSTENNKITAGNLDIELYHKKGDVREKITEETKLFDMALWEPGAVVYENFEIVNEGSLALYYDFVFNIINFNSINGTNKSLKDALKVAVVEGEFTGDREAAKALDYRQNISDFVRQSSLNEKGASEKFAVVVYWEPTDADNDFNLNNGKTSNDGQPLYIDLGINLEARQNTYEEDSFGNDYDVVEVSTDAALKANIKKAKNGEVIRLTNDIALSTTVLEFPENANVTIDLDNHTLSGNATMYVDPGRQVNIKNGEMNFNRPKMNNPTTYVYGGSTLTLENVKYNSSSATGITPYGVNAVINIINCDFNTAGYAISTNANHPEYTSIINIKNSRIVASSNPEHYGTPILLNIPSELNIENSTIEGRRNAVIVRGGTAVIKNSTLINSATPEEGEDNNTMWDTGSGVPKAVLTMGNRSDKLYRYPTNVTLVNTTLTSLDNIYPGVYAYGNTEDGMGVTFNYDATSTVGKVVVGNDKVVINGVNAPVTE